MKNAFYFTLKALFVLKIFKFLFQNLWCQNLVNKQLQHTYWPISHEVKQGNKVMKLGQLYGNIWKLITCFYVISSHFLKEGDSTSLQVLLPYFLHDFSRNVFLLLYFNTWPNFVVWFPLLLKVLGNMCIVIVF